MSATPNLSVNPAGLQFIIITAVSTALSGLQLHPDNTLAADDIATSIATTVLQQVHDLNRPSSNAALEEVRELYGAYLKAAYAYFHASYVIDDEEKLQGLVGELDRHVCEVFDDRDSSDQEQE
nr:hypothetical protein B0A51_01455 [Rachicladosporium sp. CCFEE 5018]